ncbi:uncharacterized protein B0I36DRAFT_411571 [Microdochium trichocladiopsis]|uniref:CorA-like transporter domain-containing protein n=1 Tax=Microdochium trichocladiopsis TaxID=1682393 RepID=A0A9P8Y5T4_9PEZI|nr:uncharacterized protein B0I36DRAFT_411571 [Microdochium trichocladiopsis]KAH7029580.1 hypothetical protein B0I36DRAFT_411571 [Microdochium trichocladiopsis]
MSSGAGLFIASCRRFGEYPLAILGDNEEEKWRAELHKQWFDDEEERPFMDMFNVNKTELRGFDFSEALPEGHARYHYITEDDLRSHLGMGASGSDDWAIKQDPKCRVFLFESLNPWTFLLRVKAGMAKLLFTYHQVHSYYLYFMGFHVQYGMAMSLHDNYGSFHGDDSLEERSLAIPELGRSGHRIRLSYALRTAMWQRPTHMEMQRRNENLTVDEIHKKEDHEWCKPEAIVHHQFDLITGNSLWIITTARLDTEGSKKSPIWERFLSPLFNEKNKSQAFETPQSALQANFDVHLRLAHWSIGEWSEFIQHMESSLSLVTWDMSDNPVEIYDNRNMRRLGRLSEKIDLCILDIQSNKKVLVHLQTFYKSRLGDLDTLHGYQWCHWEEHSFQTVRAFSARLDNVMSELENVRDRLEALKRMLAIREATISTLLQMQNNTEVIILSKQGQREAIIMGMFQYIALIYLPISVVSSVFSTDIVKFQDLEPGQLLSYSQEALVFWLATSLGLTVLTIGISEVVKRWRTAKHDRYVEELARADDVKPLTVEDFLDDEESIRDTRVFSVKGLRDRGRRMAAWLSSRNKASTTDVSATQMPASHQPSRKKRRTKILRPFKRISRRSSTASWAGGVQAVAATNPGGEVLPMSTLDPPKTPQVLDVSQDNTKNDAPSNGAV